MADTTERPKRIHTIQIRPEQKWALVSVSDKSGVADFAQDLVDLGYRVISTGNTCKTLIESGVPAVPVEKVTGFPEGLGGRVKTMHPRIEGGILYRRDNAEDVAFARLHRFPDIRVVACNLYPFEQTVADPKVEFPVAIENIDIGGPTMLRSAAKNYQDVTAIIDPGDYAAVIEEMNKGRAGTKLRRALMEKVFSQTAYYDALISSFLRAKSGNRFPEQLVIPLRRGMKLRYGENPHQALAYAYFEPNTGSPVAKITKVGGNKELSFVNVADVNAGYEALRPWQDRTVAVILKHLSPSGGGEGKTSGEALANAIAGDSESAYGGIAVVKGKIDMTVAEAVMKFRADQGLMDLVVGTSADPEAVKVIEKSRKDIGIYTIGEMDTYQGDRVHTRPFQGGMLVQEPDNRSHHDYPVFKSVGKVDPTPEQWQRLYEGWTWCRHIRSNTVMIMDPHANIIRAIGSGQPSRIGAARLAIQNAGEHARGGILISDSFTPKPDVAQLATEVGIGAMLIPSGSLRDNETTEIANKAGIPIVRGRERSFWH